MSDEFRRLVDQLTPEVYQNMKRAVGVRRRGLRLRGPGTFSRGSSRACRRAAFHRWNRRNLALGSMLRPRGGSVRG